MKQIPEDQLGKELRELRIARGLSMNAVARQAQVGAATVSRWEAGISKPNIPEFDAVLNVLQPTKEERQHLLALIHAPRAVIRLRSYYRDASNIPLPPPNAGGLLKAMRLRRGLSQSDLADRLRIAQSSVARWERGDTWPTESELHRICAQLSATDEELFALTSNPESLAPMTSGENLSFEEAKEWARKVIWSSLEPDQPELVELNFLQLIAALWNQYLNWHEEGRKLFASVLARLAFWYLRPQMGAIYLSSESRVKEAIYLATMTLRTSKDSFTDASVMANIVLAQAKANQNAKRYAKQSAATLMGLSELNIIDNENWPADSIGADYAAWAVRDASIYMEMLGQQEEALLLLRKAIDISKRCERTVETHLRTNDYVEMLLRANRPQDALAQLPNDESYNPSARAWQRLLRGEALYQVANYTEARASLRLAKESLEVLTIENFQNRAEKLSAALGEGEEDRRGASRALPLV